MERERARRRAKEGDGERQREAVKESESEREWAKARERERVTPSHDSKHSTSMCTHVTKRQVYSVVCVYGNRWLSKPLYKITYKYKAFMYTYAYACVCVYVCVLHGHIYFHLHVYYIRKWLHTHNHEHMYVYMHTHTYDEFFQTYMCMYTKKCIYTYVFILSCTSCGDWIGTCMSADTKSKMLQRDTESNKAASIQKR